MLSRLLCRIVCVGTLASVATFAAEEPADIVAWEAFMNAARDTGTAFLREHPQGNEKDRAEALLYLTQQLSSGVQQTLAAADTALPLLRVGATNINKWGLDSADARYLGAALQDDASYRLSGTLGSAKLTAVQVVTDYPQYRAHASLSGRDLQADSAGRFEVHLGRTPSEGWNGPWLPLPEGANRLVVREYFGDWSQEHPGAWTLERLDQENMTPSDRVSPALVADQLEEIVALFTYRLAVWMPWLAKTRSERLNTLQQLSPGGQGLLNNVYGEGWFSLDSDEVLLIVLEAPEADLWSLQLGNLWWESLEYIHRTGSINGDQAIADPDGLYRIVVAPSDPGYANWLDTGGREEGAMMYRFLNSLNAPVPLVLRLSTSELQQHMPANAALISAEERTGQIALRRQHVLKRWAP